MSGTSSNRTFHDVLQTRLSRRGLLAGGLVTAGLGLLPSAARPDSITGDAANVPRPATIGIQRKPRHK